jgi:hypothetical protein
MSVNCDSRSLGAAGTFGFYFTYGLGSISRVFGWKVTFGLDVRGVATGIVHEMPNELLGQ